MIRTFEHFPQDKYCIICGTNNDEECFLLPIDGTSENNKIERAEVAHTSCIVDNINNMRYNPEINVIYLVIN